MYQPKVSRPPLPGFVSCSKTLLDEEENLPNARKRKDSTRIHYKLIEKAGYDFNNPVALGKVVEVDTYSLNKTLKKIQEQGGLVKVPKAGLGYTFDQDIRVTQGQPKCGSTYLC